MTNLNDIIQSAQGGRAIDNIAGRFGITPEQAQSAIAAVLPAFQMGLQNNAQSGGLGTILRHLGNPTHQEAYNDPSVAQSSAAVQGGSSVLGDLFGQHASTQVAQQASAQSGVSASVIQAMLPTIAAIVMGGLFHSAQNGGMGGMLSQIIGAAMGGQGQAGSTFGQTPNNGQYRGAPDGSPSGEADQGGLGGLGGMIGSVLGGLFGGAQQQGSMQQTAPADETPSSWAPGSSPSPAGTGNASADSALDDLSRMFQAGTPAAPEHESRLADILGRG